MGACCDVCGGQGWDVDSRDVMRGGEHSTLDRVVTCSCAFGDWLAALDAATEEELIALADAHRDQFIADMEAGEEVAA
jgi:hypothetical protein